MCCIETAEYGIGYRYRLWIGPWPPQTGPIQRPQTSGYNGAFSSWRSSTFGVKVTRAYRSHRSLAKELDTHIFVTIKTLAHLGSHIYGYKGPESHEILIFVRLKKMPNNAVML